MPEKKREYPKEKSGLHPRSRHRERYDFKALIGTCPELARFVKVNDYDDESIDFFDPYAVKMLNKALLKHYYSIDYWDIPQNYLCPSIPGRADYIHHIADLLGSFNNGQVPTGDKVKCLDIGVGASCVYPIIGIKEYGWSFTGTEIDPIAMESASKIIDLNPILKGKVELRLQENPDDFFINGIVKKGEYFDISVCNPPFHSSKEEAQAGSIRKLNNLTHKNVNKPVLNFGGKEHELWCEGGEERFVSAMVYQSRRFAESCTWFSSLISKESSLRSVLKALQIAGAFQVKTIPMGQGNKKSRIIVWTF